MQSKQSVTAFDPSRAEAALRNIEHYRRDKSFWRQVTLLDLDTGHVAATVRFYGSAATVYCVAWLHLWNYPAAGEGASDCGPGMGRAGGYGYHKASAAAQEALRHAGFDFAHDFGGVGNDAISDALRAIAAHIGITRPLVHVAHA